MSGDGVKASDSNDHILYDSATGMMSYDADGNGAGAPIPFLQLAAHLNITKFDVFVI